VALEIHFSRYAPSEFNSSSSIITNLKNSIEKIGCFKTLNFPGVIIMMYNMIFFFHFFNLKKKKYHSYMRIWVKKKNPQ